MAYTTIDDASLYFRIKTYTGNGTNDTAYTWDETHANMQPDWLWFKNRDENQSHAIFDSVRGATLRIIPNETGAEGTENTNLDSFDSNGFTVDNELIVNGSSDKMVAWGWKAGTSFTNDASSTGIGSIDSSGSVSTDAGFSIISYTGTGSAGTVAHGLGAAPSVLIHKKRTTSAEAWSVFHQSVGITKRMILSSTEAETADASPQPDWNDVLPTSSVFTIGTSPRTNATEDYICYAFAEKQGYSKFGSYTGNGNADGTFVYTGFKPAWVMLKRTDTTKNWLVLDNKINTFNPYNTELSPNLSATEATNIRFDSLSNGFKLRLGSGASNASGGTYIYMAFAENPFVTSTGVPATAR
jgi:hypothetical protein